MGKFPSMKTPLLVGLVCASVLADDMVPEIPETPATTRFQYELVDPPAEVDYGPVLNIFMPELGEGVTVKEEADLKPYEFIGGNFTAKRISLFDTRATTDLGYHLQSSARTTTGLLIRDHGESKRGPHIDFCIVINWCPAWLR